MSALGGGMQPHSVLQLPGAPTAVAKRKYAGAPAAEHGVRQKGVRVISGKWLWWILVMLVLGVRTGRSACLDYEPAKTTLIGTLRTKVFPGSPNFTSVAQGDRPERAILLTLRAPICVNDDSERTNGVNVGETDIREVQLLIFDDALRSRAERVTGTVAATGELMHQITGHHHSKVLMVVQTLTRVPSVQGAGSGDLPVSSLQQPGAPGSK